MNIIRNKNFILAAFLLGIMVTVYSCDGIFPTASRDVLLPDHTRNLKGVMHKETGKEIELEDCMECHTDDIKGMSVKINGVYRWTPSCIQCHGRVWEKEGDPDTKK